MCVLMSFDHAIHPLIYFFSWRKINGDFPIFYFVRRRRLSASSGWLTKVNQGKCWRNQMSPLEHTGFDIDSPISLCKQPLDTMSSTIPLHKHRSEFQQMEKHTFPHSMRTESHSCRNGVIHHHHHCNHVPPRHRLGNNNKLLIANVLRGLTTATSTAILWILFLITSDTSVNSWIDFQ